MKIDLILFDLDGTLIDSKPDIVIAVNRALTELGHPTFDEETVGRCIGYGIHDLFQKLLKDSIRGEPLDLLIETYRQYYREKMSEHSKVYPGIVEVLEHFQAIGRAVLTNKNQKFAEQILRELEIDHLFSKIYGGDAFKKQKPDPLPILEICKVFGVDPARTVMVGDSEVDLAAAKAAGAQSVILKYGYGNQEKIRALRPDHWLEHAIEIKDLFTH